MKRLKIDKNGIGQKVDKQWKKVIYRKSYYEFEKYMFSKRSGKIVSLKYENQKKIHANFQMLVPPTQLIRTSFDKINEGSMANI